VDREEKVFCPPRTRHRRLPHPFLFFSPRIHRCSFPPAGKWEPPPPDLFPLGGKIVQTTPKIASPLAFGRPFLRSVNLDCLSDFPVPYLPDALNFSASSLCQLLNDDTPSNRSAGVRAAFTPHLLAKLAFFFAFPIGSLFSSPRLFSVIEPLRSDWVQPNTTPNPNQTNTKTNHQTAPYSCTPLLES